MCLMREPKFRCGTDSSMSLSGSSLLQCDGLSLETTLLSAVSLFETSQLRRLTTHRKGAVAIFKSEVNSILFPINPKKSQSQKANSVCLPTTLPAQAPTLPPMAAVLRTRSPPAAPTARETTTIRATTVLVLPTITLTITLTREWKHLHLVPFYSHADAGILATARTTTATRMARPTTTLAVATPATLLPRASERRSTGEVLATSAGYRRETAGA